MGTFLADGSSVIPPVKSDVRPATVPQAIDEWAAEDANQIRQALLDLRAYLIALSGVITGGGVITDLRFYMVATGDSATVSDSTGFTKAP